jgi:hypothetical protein
MKLVKLGALLAVCAAMALSGAAARAATKYGDALVEQGSMTIVREGRSLEYKVSANAVEVQEKDLVRVRDDSRVQLTTADKATLTLGANAIFQVEPWQSNQKQGLFRMLFGRFRASVGGLAGTERFNVKTATAVIGVKGTEYSSAVTIGGYTAVLGIDSVTTNEGSDGVEQPVTTRQVSVTASPATPAVPAPPAFLEAMQNFNSPPPGSAGALFFPAMDSLVQAGIVSPRAGDKWKQEREGGGAGAGTGQGDGTAPPAPNIDDAQQTGNTIKGTLRANFGN